MNNFPLILSLIFTISILIVSGNSNDAFAAKLIVNIPEKTGSPGCETSNSCFDPFSIKIKAGDKVEWRNQDTAPHTVTSGIPSNGSDGIFDSGMLMENTSLGLKSLR